MPRVPLSTIAVARSGDKGPNANVGVIARSPKHWPAVREVVTADLLRRVFADLKPTAVDVYAMPNLHAINFVLHNVLSDGGEGSGGSDSLRLDAQGKTFAQRLLMAEVDLGQ